ncbi:hypothetical protein K4K56_002154 [Colletotrichum sp. SAR 10_98]|nr:hypothetical protein K4K56_002154 [Colletotrichum sp. SAR 10_98]
MFCRWSTDDWRAYIKWLEQVVDAETKMALLAPTTGGYHYTIYTAADIQRFLIWQEKISESITVLESNIEVMKSLMRFYTKLDENQDFDLRSSCTDDIDEFCTQLYSMVNDFTLQISRAKALVKLTGDRGELIKQHRLERLNHNMEKEAILVRIVTIVTLIYLPATFVSTFFSTDIIKYQDSDSPKGTFSPIAMERWLQVTLPLTSLTLLVAYYGNKWAESKSRGRMLPTARVFASRDQEENSSTEEFGHTGAGYGPTTAFTTDSHLGFHNLSHLYTDIEQALNEDKVTLPKRYTSAGYAGVTRDFERQRWAFHPALNVLDMVEVGIEGKSILPFFGCEIINEGGTAEVHHHKIHVDLVESDNLRQILEPRKQDHKTGIEKYYEFAVKTYLKGFDDIYKLESDAFKGFNGTKDPRSLGVVTYLGEYTRHDRGDDGVSAQGVTRHIMLEFGEQDLDEYLAATYPPVLNEEIIAFWGSLFEIAKTLGRIHQLERVRGDKVQKYVGWHGDIKPDNILRVRGEFKLADFGFTRFEKSVIGKPQTTYMLGGTRTGT